MTTEQYSGKNVTVFKGLEGVRHRPGMYVGDTDKRGLHQLIFEIVDNSIDEAMAGHATYINVSISADGKEVRVRDNGRGIPVDTHPTENISTLEVVMTMLHAGGKMMSSDSGYIASGGLHGVGASCVNALSSALSVRVWRDEGLWEQKYSKGIPLTPVLKLRPLSDTDDRGTQTQWTPDPEIFKGTIEYDDTILIARLKERAYLNKGLTIRYSNYKTNIHEVFCFTGGISNFVLDLVSSRNGIYPLSPITFESKVGSVKVCVSGIWTDDSECYILSYANNISTADGGTHHTSLKAAITKAVNKAGVASGKLKNTGDYLESRDIHAGFVGVVSVILPQPQFVGQTKDRLSSAEAGTAVFSVVTEQLHDYLVENPTLLSRVIDRAIIEQKARDAAKNAAAMIKKRSFLGNSLRIPGKLKDCRSANLNDNELFIVEGDSAAGSAATGRDSETQAILSAKGKILNAERADENALIANEEISNLMMSIGTGIGEDFNMSKLRYGKIIIMSDSDDDGKHIRVLLLSFFYRYMKPLLLANKIYIAVAPLYLLEYGKNSKYIWTPEDLEKEIKILEAQSVKYDVKRFKGLGEMNADELAETTMNVNFRKLIQVHIEDAVEAERIVSTLMGKNAQNRKDHLLDKINNTGKNNEQ